MLITLQYNAFVTDDCTANLLYNQESDGTDCQRQYARVYSDYMMIIWSTSDETILYVSNCHMLVEEL